ncbi:MAG TPA: amino acid adenylation domain-containing protein, partial [Blastocatellia bacterium]
MELEQLGSGIETDEKQKYWLEALSQERETIGLPLEYERPRAYSGRKQSFSFTIQDDIYEGLTALTNGSLLLVYTAAVTALVICLHKYTGANSIVVGSPVRKPSDGSFERPNALPIAVDLEGQSQVRHILLSVRDTLLKAYANQDYPFQRIVQDLQIDGVENRCPLFNVAIALKNIHYPMPDVRNDVMISLSLLAGRLEATIDFNESLFIIDSVERFGRHFENLLGQAVRSKEGLVCDMQVLTPEEQRRASFEWNDTKSDYSAGTYIHQLFETQASRAPDAVAVVYEDEQITYGDLSHRANQLAQRLQFSGVGPGALVPVLMERSVEMVVALVGILKAGGAYLPLDPDYPQGRLDLMIKGARSPVLLTQEHLRHKLLEKSVGIISLDTDPEAFGREAGADFESCVSPGQLAYVIYTSGSTGKPKGVMISHRAICNRLLWMQAALPLTPGDSVLQKTPFTFDASVWEFFVPLIAGARVVIAKPGGHKDSAYMIQAIKDHQVTVLQLVPSMLRVFIEEEEFPECTTLQRVFCGGEALPFDLQERFFARTDSELHNLYGPTEAAVDVTHWACERGDKRRTVPVGRPIANAQCYILYEGMQLAAVGAGGEMHLGGVGLAHGYLSLPDLTAEKFIPHPFSAEPGARLYRTGDLARYLAQGEIEYLGRIDNQVKLRGFRIELGEIEAVLCRHTDIQAAVVVAREVAPGDKNLVAYIVARHAVSSGGFKEYVAEHLPGYMVPSAFVMLEELPRTPNGKVDRQS